MTLRILAVSDEVDQRIYSPTLRERMQDIQLVIGCGDVPASYLEFLVDSLNRPTYFVLGNHAEELTRQGERGVPRLPEGCIDLGGKVIRDPTYGLLMAGLPGSPRYSEHEPVQYTELQMNWMMLRMASRLVWNRVRYGRFLDVLVTHSPPRDVNDREDFAHRDKPAMSEILPIIDIARWRMRDKNVEKSSVANTVPDQPGRHPQHHPVHLQFSVLHRFVFGI